MKIEEQHKKALEEDPSVFDYDGVYDDMKEKIAKPKIQEKTERKVTLFSRLLIYCCCHSYSSEKQPKLGILLSEF